MALPSGSSRVCLKRVTDYRTRLLFGDKVHYFYQEECCGNRAVKEGTCALCLMKNPESKKQCSRTFEHGFVTDKYLEVSHFFDSPWYHRMVKVYGMPSQADIEMAKASQASARAGKSTPTPVAASTKPVAEVKQDPSKRGRKKPTEAAAAPTSGSTTALPASGSTLTTPVKALPPSSDTKVETMDDPLRVTEVIRVILRPFTHGRTTYWRDSASEKVYSQNSKGGVGKYVGRWSDSRQMIVTNAPDSDVDGECV